MARGYGWGGFAPYVSVAERAAKAAKIAKRLAKGGAVLEPIELKGRTIAKTFWGKSWCENIESYRDYAYRLERGRSYVRSGMVLDLKITAGKVSAIVAGSTSRPYTIDIKIDPMNKNRWQELVKRSTGRISSLLALSQGKLPEDMLKDFCNQATGLFPTPKEIHFDCSCPDGAYCRKHIAAVLYGIGARLDEQPELFFTLRSIDPKEIVAAEVVDTVTSGAEAEIASDDLAATFGISLDGLDDIVPPAAKPEPDVALPSKPFTALSPKPVAESIATPKKKRAGRKPEPEPFKLSDAVVVKQLRLKLKLSQGAFGKLIGTSQPIISLIERGKYKLTASIQKKLSVLGKSEN